jgi:hypothetical protein
MDADAVTLKKNRFLAWVGEWHGETAVSWTRAGLMVTEETRKGTMEVSETFGTCREFHVGFLPGDRLGT